MSLKRVAVIGAGASGLTSIKSLKEENIEPVCFERNNYCAGLWHYHEEDVEGSASVMKNTVINSSKELSAFSDFPPPDHMPSFMHNTELVRYFTLYAEHFDLLRHIHYQKEVINVELSPDYEDTGRLIVRVKDTQTFVESENIFDGVLVCTGHHVYPKIPTFPGQERFRGKIIHTHRLKTVEQFTDQVVAVVGVGNSGMDAAVEISSVSNQVYLSTRRGTWVTPRLGPTGLPLDSVLLTRFKSFLFDIMPYSLSCWFLELVLNRWFDHETFNLKPNHRVNAQHVTVSDILPLKLLAGTIKLKKNLVQFTEDGALFENDNLILKLDAVVLATGYDIKFPFLNDMVTVEKNKVELYKFMFPPGLTQNTLAIIGLIQPLGPFFPCMEAQARLASMVINGKIKLPSHQQMKTYIRLKNEANRKRYAISERHTIQTDYIPYLDELNEMIGSKPSLWKLLITDLVLWFHVVFGPSLPYQYRLTGPHSWPKAREAILDYRNRIVKPLQEHCQVKHNYWIISRAISIILSILKAIVAAFVLYL